MPKLVYPCSYILNLKIQKIKTKNDIPNTNMSENTEAIGFMLFSYQFSQSILWQLYDINRS